MVYFVVQWYVVLFCVVLCNVMPCCVMLVILFHFVCGVCCPTSSSANIRIALDKIDGLYVQSVITTIRDSAACNAIRIS